MPGHKIADFTVFKYSMLLSYFGSTNLEYHFVFFCFQIEPILSSMGLEELDAYFTSNNVSRILKCYNT